MQTTGAAQLVDTHDRADVARLLEANRRGAARLQERSALEDVHAERSKPADLPILPLYSPVDGYLRGAKVGVATTRPPGFASEN